MRADQVIVNYGLLIFEKVGAPLFCNTVENFVLVLQQKAKLLMKHVQSFRILVQNFLLLEPLSFSHFLLKKFEALCFGLLVFSFLFFVFFLSLPHFLLIVLDLFILSLFLILFILQSLSMLFFLIFLKVNHILQIRDTIQWHA